MPAGDAIPSSGPIGEDAAPRREAWDRFYAYCFDVIRTSPSIRRLSSADRDDCIQDVMLEIVKKFGAADRDIEDDNVEGWIRTVSRNKAADIVRRRVRKPEVPISEGTENAFAASRDTTAESLATGESISVVWEALLALDQEVTVTSYLIFFLRQIEGWSVGDIADTLQLTSDQVRFRTHRVKNRFAEILKTQSSDSASGPAPA